VRGPGGVAPPAGRQVEAVDIATGRRYATETNPVGGFSLLLPPGRYRVEVALTPGETVVESPGIVTVEPSELADEQDVILGGAGVVDERGSPPASEQRHRRPAAPRGQVCRSGP
jgi:hypothetical protein